MTLTTILRNSLGDIPGLRVGHSTDLQTITGCTVILCPSGTVGGVDQRGGAPGTRETDLLLPMRLVEQVDAVVLSGGSAFGLSAADGVMRYLAERGQGYRSRAGFTIPIVPTAILFDLAIGSVRPESYAELGYAACVSAGSDAIGSGSIGAGTGCRIGAMRGNDFATKGGLGSASIRLADDVVVASLMAVNAVGDVIDHDGRIIAGLHDGSQFVNLLQVLRTMPKNITPPAAPSENTVIGVVATNAKLNKTDVNKVAQMAHDGLARAVRPAHTMFDGDTIFALSTGEIAADVNVIGAFAAEVVAQAIRNAVSEATSLGGVLAASDLKF